LYGLKVGQRIDAPLVKERLGAVARGEEKEGYRERPFFVTSVEKGKTRIAGDLRRKLPKA